MRIAAVLLAFLPAAVTAQTSAPPSEAAIEEFLAALPPSAPVSRAADAEQLARLSALNPGKAGEIERILTVYQACIVPVIETNAIEMIRSVAISMGERKLRRLSQFYKSPEFPLFAKLADKHSSGQTLSSAETARLNRFGTEYPLEELAQKMQEANDAAASNQALITKFTKCSLDKKTALIRAGVRLN
jgi:hypothetical protein